MVLFFLLFWFFFILVLRGPSLAGLCAVDESAQITLFPPSEAKLQVILISSALCSAYLPPAATLGTLDFSLLYDQENNALHCTINKAKVSRRHADANDDVSIRPWMCPLIFLSDVDLHEILKSFFFWTQYVSSCIYFVRNCDTDFEQTHTW